MFPDIEAVTRILREAAAEEILPRFQALKEHEIREKERGELVTVADEAAEKVISRRLADLLPGSLVVGEEATAADPGLMDQLAGDGWIWIIDPIDGTANFARGKTDFAVMAGLLRAGRTAAGWILDVMGDRMAVAEQDAGAWLDGERLQVAAEAPLGEMRGTLHAGTFAGPEMVRQVQARRERVGAVKSLRCAGFEYLRLARGEMHFSLFTRLMPWDHVPGCIIQSEAGGIARTLDGDPYGARSFDAPGLLLAPGEAAWQALHGALFGPD